MPGTQSLSEIRTQISSKETLVEKSFSILKQLGALLLDTEAEPEVQEIVLRILEHRSALGPEVVILDAVVRELGLFPYLDRRSLTLKDQIAYEFHRPHNMGAKLVFHRPQAQVYRRLLDGDSVALSAPMSFGKSLIVDALIASGNHRNIVIVVPTIALIDETRKRLSERFRDQFKIITHATQEPSSHNVYVLTQERVLEYERFPNLDLFVIDEFYKLSPDRGDDKRSALLNQAFYMLKKQCSQFYMLGPSINALASGFQERVDCHFMIEPYHTVASNLRMVSIKGGKTRALMNLCRGLTEPTLVFCSSPQRAADVATLLVEENITGEASDLNSASEWIAEHYHEDWHFVRALRRGIGVHHGRIPRALAQYVVRRFNEDHIKFLVCTSTLIEGVNTKARNVIIYDKKIARTDIDLFTFNNIRGRSGRMFQYFVGNVYLFYPPPETELPFVDVPIYTQPDDLADSLLVQIDEDDLTERSREKLNRLKDQDWLDLEVIRKNRGIDPESQLALAQSIVQSSDRIHRELAWHGMPNTKQLQLVCEMIWNYFDGRELGRGSVTSVKQLRFLINRLRSTPTIRDMIDDQIRFWGDADKSVQKTLDFIKLWATFNFPRLLRAVSAIQADVLVRLGKPAGNYESFAYQVENLFLDPTLVALDEYGIPLELARKLSTLLGTDGNLDEALNRLRSLDIPALKVSDFERELLYESQRTV